MIEITLNGQPLHLADNTSVAQLIQQQQLEGTRIAVELNREIVPRSQQRHTILCPKDCVEIVVAVGGG